jgi:magnesium transporter
MIAEPTAESHLNDSVLKHVRKDYVRIAVGDTVGDALARVQQSRVEGRIVYFYVVDPQERLVGVLPTRRLLLSPPQTAVADLMVRKVVTLPAKATLMDACEFFIMHRLLALPVVDKGGRVLGVVDVELYTDEVSDLARRQESDALFQLIGVRLARVGEASIPAAVRGRFPWLLCNIAGGLGCAVLAAFYESVLSQVVALAMFIPLVLALAESVSIQSLTLALQAHDTGRFRWPSALRALRREMLIGLLLGAACGGLVGVAAWLWQQHVRVATCILLSIVLSVATAALFGLAMPTLFRAIQRDPKVASGPLALAMTDVATLFWYLGLATWMLR